MKKSLKKVRVGYRVFKIDSFIVSLGGVIVVLDEPTRGVRFDYTDIVKY